MSQVRLLGLLLASYVYMPLLLTLELEGITPFSLELKAKFL